MGLVKGAVLSLEALTKQMKVSNDRPNHRVTSGHIQRFCANQMRIVIQNSKLGTG